jgi:hypothetical protein
MNQIGEKIEINECKCREMYLPDLKTLINPFRSNKVASWGAHNFIVDNTKQPRMFRMMVQGNHFRGHVYLFLNGADLFDVYLTSIRGTIKDRTDEMGIYVDQLIDWIDRKVERIPEYVR